MEKDDFFCGVCGGKCLPRFFAIVRNAERAIYDGSTLIGFDVGNSPDFIGLFCSRVCLDKARNEAMARERVHLPALRPEISPVSSCAVCDGAVPMIDWHVTYEEIEAEGIDETSYGVLALDIVAIACRKCTAQEVPAESHTVSIERWQQPQVPATEG